MKKFLILILLGLSMASEAQQPKWVAELSSKLGAEVMSKPAHELTGEDLFNIYHVTKNINGADDGVYPMFESSGEKTIPILKAKLSEPKTSKAELATAKEIVEIFFSNNTELKKLSAN